MTEREVKKLLADSLRRLRGTYYEGCRTQLQLAFDAEADRLDPPTEAPPAEPLAVREWGVDSDGDLWFRASSWYWLYRHHEQEWREALGSPHQDFPLRPLDPDHEIVVHDPTDRKTPKLVKCNKWWIHHDAYRASGLIQWYDDKFDTCLGQAYDWPDGPHLFDAVAQEKRKGEK